MNSLYNTLAKRLEKKFKFDAHYFLKGGFWLSLGQSFTILFGLTSTALFAHFLTENEYGVYRYLLGIASLLSAFSLTGLGQAILQTAAKGFSSFYKETLHINLFYSLGISLFALIGSIYYLSNNNTILALGCVAIAVIQPIINTYQFFPSFLQGTRQFSKSTKIHFCRMFFITSSSLLALYLTNNVLILFVVYLCSIATFNIVTQLLYKPYLVSTPSDVYARYLRYAKNTSIRNIVSNVSQRIDAILIFTQLGSVELAVYSVSVVIPEQAKVSLKNLASLLLPKYSSDNNLKARLNGVTKRTIQLGTLLSLITIGYIAVTPFLMPIIFPKYPNAILYSQLSALAFPTFVLYIPYSILQSQLAEKALYKLTLYSSLFLIFALTIGTIGFGVIGAIIARVVHRLFLMVLTYLSVFNLYKNVH